MASIPSAILGIFLSLGLLVWNGCNSRGKHTESDASLGYQVDAQTERSKEIPQSKDEVDPKVAALLQESQLASSVVPTYSPAAIDQSGSCPVKGKKEASIGILITPHRPTVRDQIRVVVASLSQSLPYAIRIKDRKGNIVETTLDYRLGFPATTVAHLPKKISAGTFTVEIGLEGTISACAKLRVSRASRDRAGRPADLEKVWSARRTWDRAEEALYSSWIRELFHAKVDQDLAFRALHEVTSDRSRNLLHDYLGMNEDASESGLVLNPDCADTPYFLRAYYAWKRKLPFVFRRCNRGRVGKAPRCIDQRSNLDPPDLKPEWQAVEDPQVNLSDLVGGKPAENPKASSEPPSEVLSKSLPATEPPKGLAVIQYFFRKTLGWGVHTGNGRVALTDEQSDLYPVQLSRESIRPGTVYADPYGHILVVAEFIAPHGSTPGILFAIDGQPDSSITRKRFWEGNFLWNPDPSLGGSGFKNFRPAKVVEQDGLRRVATLENAEITKNTNYGDFSDSTGELSQEQFYDAMEALVTPGLRNPFRVQKAAIEALAEAVRIRLTSVNNGIQWHKKNPTKTIEMPDGHSVFETSGPWEDFSTPARDLRLLIAIDVVLGFAKKVERNAKVFQLEEERLRQQVLSRLKLDQQKYLQDPQYIIKYLRSDGSTFSLTLAQVVSRQSELELAYNPNDCPEIRWGAKEGTDEYRTCNRRAPELQQKKMMAYRPWFRGRKRPARGDSGPSIQP